MEMKDKEHISEEIVKDVLTQSVSYFFSTMTGWTSSLIDEYAPDASGEQHDLVVDSSMLASCIGFTGEVNGMAYIYLNEHTAFAITKKMLSMDEETLKSAGDALVDDCIGEVANMTVGYFKNKLSEVGICCALTVPSIIRGKDLKVNIPLKQSDNFRKCYKYSIEDGAFVIDLYICTA